MKTYKEVLIKNITAEKAEMLVALLHARDYDGFEEGEDFLKAYIAEEDFVLQELESLAVIQEFYFKVQDVCEQNWNALWESNFTAVQVGNFVRVRAAFHESAPDTRFNIEITPKMSFGTGHHATTYLMIQAMESVNFVGKSVFDFGTGTGILAILAEKLGAAAILAVDNDEWALENAEENIRTNNCKKIRIIPKNNAAVQQKFDVILANINKNILLQNMQTLSNQLTADGVLLMSGLLAEDEDVIKKAAYSTGLNVVAIKNRLQWILLRFTTVDH